MALTPSTPGRRWLRLHVFLRFAGLTGLLAAGVGLFLAAQAFDLRLWPAWRSALENLFSGRTPDTLLAVALGLLLGGGLLALLALIVESVAALRVVAGRREAFGGNVAVQVLLAAVLLAGVNVFSFRHYLRFDWTRDRLFTLSPETRDQLRQLQGETTIVVYQRHKTFGQFSDKPDAYDYAAERKVVEKVQDLVDEFQELGPQFKVVVLDVEEEGYSDKLARLTAGSQDLRTALDSAPENSIFFVANGKVQRLSFNDFYQLDKTASQEANGGRGNLVLLAQGVEPFARKVLNIDEKRPRVAVGVVHEVLSTEGSEELGMGGVKKALQAHGLDSRDVILKKWNEFTGPEPAVLTFDETKYERLEEQLTDLDANIRGLESDLQELRRQQKTWETASLDQLTKDYAKQLEVERVTEQIRQAYLARAVRPNLALLQVMLDQQREEREAAAKEKAGLNVESLTEQRRIADLRAKTNRMLADCDLLILPRMTLFNAARGERIPNRVYQLDQAQAEAVKDFLKAGKPVLVCFGPTNEPANRMEPPSATGPDQLEGALEQLGIRFGRETVLFNVESKSFAERRGGLIVLGTNVEVPPVEFDWQPGAGRPSAKAVTDEKAPNPVRRSMRLAARSLGKDQALDLRLRHPRPIYYEPAPGRKQSFEAEFMLTNPASWNEADPFPTRERTPRFEPPKADDPTKGTRDEKRRGPFPIGVAVETTLPPDWYSEKATRPAEVRVAAIGHGGVFIGPTLSPAREKLLLDLCNWLMGRDDLLTKDEQRWQYPRVALSERDQRLWQWGTALGMPVLFAYLGLVVLMVRRVR
jgi:hypothetical protein